jgi:hypothetical protein
MTTDTNAERARWIGTGLAMGAAFGVVVGAMFGNVALGVAMGPAIGLAVALAWFDARQRRRPERDSAPGDAAQDDQTGL